MDRGNVLHSMVVLVTVALVGCMTDEGKPSGASSGAATSGGTSSGGTSSGGTSSGGTSSGGTSSGGAVTGNDAGGIEPSAEAGAKMANAQIGCTNNSDCESNICFLGGGQSFCTVTCTAANAATACATPFTGSCNNKGFCKRD